MPQPTGERASTIPPGGHRVAPPPRARQAFLTVDPQWQVLRVDDPDGLLTCRPERLLGAELWSVVHPGPEPSPLEGLAPDSVAGVRHAPTLVRSPADDGSDRWLELTVLPRDRVHDGAGDEGYDVVIRDEMDHAALREVLQFERDRRRAILAQSSDSVMFFAPDCSIQWASPATERLFGMRAEELVGRNGVDLIHPADRDRAFLTFLTMADPGASATLEFRVLTGDGRVRWVEETATNLVHDPGVGYVVASLRDVTDRHHADERIALQARVLEAVGQSVVAVDTDHRVIYWNEAAERLYGWTSEEAIGRPISDLVRPADGWEATGEAVIGRVAEGDTWSGEFWITRRDGTTIPVLVTDTAVHDPDGKLVAIVGVSADLSERIEAERVRTQLSAIVTSSNDAILTSTVDGVLTSWNPGAVTLFGHEADDVVGHPTRLLVPDDQVEEFRGLMAEVAAGRPVIDHETVRQRADGSRIAVSVSLSPIRDHSGAVVEVSAIVRDITERRAAQDELEYRSLHDSLTGLPNRDLLLRELAAALDEGRADTVAVAFLDVDHFNLVNDSLGHLAGDRVLVALGDRLRSSVAVTDVVGRIAGDEFVVVRRGGSTQDLEELGDDLRRIMNQPLEVDGRPYVLTASIGLRLARPGEDPQEVLDDADAAMYAAKERGRDRIEHFDEHIRRRSEQRLEMATELRSALDRDELRVVYQPVVCLADGALRGFEALVRWEHPERGLISPNEFIPAAEATGLIVPIGEWVMRTAVQQLAAWRRADEAKRDLWVAVNLSGRQLEQPDLVSFAHRTVTAAGLHPRSVHLEITESMMMHDYGRWFPTLRSLRFLGFQISVDDFGTGYSSLSYLKELPVDTLKIDRSFVSGLGRDERDRSIARAVLDLATAMGLHVVAEGVEDAVQAAVLRDLGCELGQGFYWGRPVDPSIADPGRRAPATDAPAGRGVAAAGSLREG